MNREFAWILGALGVVIVLEYALGIEPQSVGSLVLIAAVLLGVAVLGAVVFALRRGR